MTMISSSPESRTTDRPGANSRTHKLDSSQPADSGVTDTVYGVVPVDLAGRYHLLFIRCCRSSCLAVHVKELSAHKGYRGFDRGGDVVIVGVQQRAADDEASHRGQCQCLGPAGECGVRVHRV